MSSDPAPLLHVLGAGPWQLPTIRRAQSLGCRVLVTDGWADRPGYRIADLHEVIDITDVEATLAAARRHRIDGVLCDTTDTGVLAAATVADALGLPGPGLAAAWCCTDKASMTNAAAAAGLSVPQTAHACSAGQARALAAVVPHPWAIKPVDAQAGKGVSFVESPDALDAAIDLAFEHSRRREVLVQTWQTGVEIIVDSVSIAGEARILGVAIKTPYRDNPTVSSRITYGCEDAPVPRAVAESVHRALLSALQVRQGLVHAEYLVHDGRLVPIDVAARGGGAMIYPLVLQQVSGVDVQRVAIELALGRSVPWAPRATPRAANIEFLRCAPGIIVAIDGVDSARRMRGVAAVHMNQAVGDATGDLAHKDRRLGYVVTVADTAQQAIDDGIAAARKILVGVTAHRTSTERLGSTP